MLLVGFAFVTFDFIQLTFLSERTDKYFSWTIASPLTAAVFGSFYFAAAVITITGGTQKAWVRARAVVPGTFALVLLIEIATLIHLDLFRPHLNSPDGLTRFEFWVWIGAYSIEPPGLLIGMLLQRRMPGVDPPRLEPLPRWYCNLGLAGGLGAAALGAVMFLVPTALIGVWSWTLTPLTARVLGAWFVASGLVLAVGVWENDRWRLLVPALAFCALSPLQFIAIARFSGEIDWGNPQIWGHTLFLIGVFALGIVGIAMSVRARKPSLGAAPPAPAPLGAGPQFSA